jgi:arylsulfatase A-like enzyme
MLKSLLAAALAFALPAFAAPSSPANPTSCSKPPNRLALLTGADSQPATAADRPNLVFILCDDLRWNALGCMGNPVIQTPNIDRLAAAGTLFRNHFATTAICCVSRASVFSGQYQRRHGIPDFATPFTAAAWAETYPALLRKAGYHTGFIGKFGVGNGPATAAMAKEFDYWKGLPGQGGEWFIDPKDPTQKHATSRFGDQALEFLAGCDATHPFSLSLSFNAPHARDGKPREFQPDVRDESLYSSESIAPPPQAADEFFQRLPDFVQKSEGRRRWERRFATPEMALNTTRDYFRLISGIDREVGRIVEALQKAGLSEHTVIVFTSDNGFFLGDRGMADKWYMYEESIRLPLIILDPRVPAANRLHTSDAMTLNIDMAPTLLDLAGLPAPARMQGTSLERLLTAKAPADWRTEFFYEHHYGPKIIPPSEGVRTEQWSYIHWMPPNPEVEELYDVREDPLEAKNRAADPAAAKVLEELRAKWQKYGESLK